MCNHHVEVKGKVEKFGSLVSAGRQKIGMVCVNCGEKYGYNGWSGRVSKWVR